MFFTASPSILKNKIPINHFIKTYGNTQHHHFLERQNAI